MGLRDRPQHKHYGCELNLRVADQDVVDGDVDELHEEANEAHDEEANTGGNCNLGELCEPTARAARGAKGRRVVSNGKKKKNAGLTAPATQHKERSDNHDQKMQAKRRRTETIASIAQRGEEQQRRLWGPPTRQSAGDTPNRAIKKKTEKNTWQAPHTRLTGTVHEQRPPAQPSSNM